MTRIEALDYIRLTPSVHYAYGDDGVPVFRLDAILEIASMSEETWGGRVIMECKPQGWGEDK